MSDSTTVSTPVSASAPSQPAVTIAPPPKKTASILRWVIFILTFFSLLLMISSTIAKNVKTWFNTTVSRLTFQFACNKNPFPNPKHHPLTAKSPYVSQLNKNKCFEYPLAITDYYYFGAAKAYQLGGSTWSIPSINVIKDVLNQGARVLEFDIFADYENPDIPVIRGFKPTYFTFNNYISIDDCFDTINEYGWKKPFENYPLFLYINLFEASEDLLNTLATKYKSKLGNRMIDNKKYGGAAVTPDFIYMSDCVSKVVLIVNTTNAHMNLKDDNQMTPSVDFDSCINCYSRADTDPAKSSIDVVALEMTDKVDITEAYNKSMKSDGDNNKSSLIEHCRHNIAVSAPVTNYNSYNIVKQDYDLESYDILDVQIYGIQINLFHLNLIDSNLNRALTIFKDGPIQLRPQYLRNIPKQGIDMIDVNNNVSPALKKFNVEYNGESFNKNAYF